MQRPVHEMSENALFRLDAAAADTDKRLFERAQDQELLFGVSTKEEIKTLLHPAGRLRSEIGYLPCSEEPERLALRDFVLATKGDAAGAVPFPEMEFSSALARLNSANTLLEVWPVEDAGSMVSLCESFALLEKEVTAQEAMDQINRDRARSGRALLDDPAVFHTALDEHIRTLCAHIGYRCSHLPIRTRLEGMEKLSRIYERKSGPLYRSRMIENLIIEHLSHDINREATMAKHRLQDLMQTYQKVDWSTSYYLDGKNGSKRGQMKRIQEGNKQGKLFFDQMVHELLLWNALTHPARTLSWSRGFSRKEVGAFYHELTNFGAHVFNNRRHQGCVAALFDAMDLTFFDLSIADREQLKKNLRVVHDPFGIKQRSKEELQEIFRQAGRSRWF